MRVYLSANPTPQELSATRQALADLRDRIKTMNAPVSTAGLKIDTTPRKTASAAEVEAARKSDADRDKLWADRLKARGLPASNTAPELTSPFAAYQKVDSLGRSSTDPLAIFSV